MANTTATTTGGLNRTVAMIAGAVLVLVGLLGFVSDPVLGIFETSLIHNLVHLLSGAALLAAAFIGDTDWDKNRNSRMALLTLGVVYALVTILGFIAPNLLDTLLGGTDTAELTALNMADNILHLLLAVAFIAIPMIAKDDVRRPTTGTRNI